MISAFMADLVASAGLLAGQGLWQARPGVRGIPSNAGFEPRFEVLHPINNSPPELAVDGTIPAQAQFRQGAGSQPQDLRRGVGGQCDRIAGRHESLTTNQPDNPGNRG
jgi:hypothetical protein